MLDRYPISFMHDSNNHISNMTNKIQIQKKTEITTFMFVIIYPNIVFDYPQNSQKDIVC